MGLGMLVPWQKLRNLYLTSIVFKITIVVFFCTQIKNQEKKGVALCKVITTIQFRLNPLLLQMSVITMTTFEYYKQLHFLVILFEGACSYRINSNSLFLRV